jgi:hypothetical protein
LEAVRGIQVNPLSHLLASSAHANKKILFVGIEVKLTVAAVGWADERVLLEGPCNYLLLIVFIHKEALSKSSGIESQDK